MSTEPRLDIIGAALADPSRSRILCELMDGRAFTNKELACAAEITPQTAHAHLKQLEAAGLTTSLRSGRHVYHQIASEDVANVLEGLASLSPTDHLTRHPNRDQCVLQARSCYNHIAGRLGVALTERLVALNVIKIQDGAALKGAELTTWCQSIGLSDVARTSGPVAKLCLDWTERRYHLSGPLATAIMAKALSEGWLTRQTGNRALILTESGETAFGKWFGLTPPAEA